MIAMSTSDLDPTAWLQALTSADLAAQGIDVFDDETPPLAANRLAEEMGVDVSNVGRCLQLLADSPVVLAGGAPVGLMGFSPRRGLYRASFDTEVHADLDALSPARAGLWLALLSAEVGPLPERAGHWLLLQLDGQHRVGGVNRHLTALANAYARAQLTGDVTPAEGLAAYDEQLGRAIWWCATHRLR